MTDRVISVLKVAKEFSIQERAELAEQLLGTLDDNEDADTPREDQAAIDASWAAEIERRVDAFHEGKIPSEPGDEVMKELFAKYKR